MSSLADRRFLITGGTGSFGQTMVSRLLDAGAAEVRVLSRDESKQDAMRHRLGDDRVRYYVGDVRDYDSVLKAVRGMEFVFHAAALKQVPSCEFFPLEAVRTNVLGSANVVDACERAGVATLVLLSTDKAVYPVNAMGMTKALMEKVAQAHSRNNPAARTRVCCVRYGNVMYLAQSVELVEHAFRYGQPGDVFIRKADACTIGDLATALCNLFGVPAKFNVLGIRHGEKLYETLASREELSHAQDLGEFLRVPIDSRDLNYALYFDEGDVERGGLTDFNSHNARRLSVAEIETLLLTLPEIRVQIGAGAATGVPA